MNRFYAKFIHALLFIAAISSMKGFAADKHGVNPGVRYPVQDTVKQNSDTLILREISLEEAYELYQSKAGYFIDSRSRFFYTRAHIRDAISICYRCTDTSTVMRQMPRDQLLIIYCSGPRCDQAQMLITKLLENSFRKIYLFSGGMDAWRAAGYPIDEIAITKKTYEP